jgi:hypothetical protein
MKWDFAFRLKWDDTLKSNSQRDASPIWAAGVTAGGVARRPIMAFALVSV